jgi:type IV secretion system protein VirD4
VTHTPIHTDPDGQTSPPPGPAPTAQPFAPPSCPFAWSWPGVRLGWQSHHPWYAGSQHATLVLGPPRSGKTTGIVAPAVIDAPGPVVATSTKADVLAATLPWRQQAGRVWYFDPSATTSPPPGLTPVRWTPLTGCQSWEVAVTRAHALAATAAATHGEHAHWIERAEALLAPLFHAAAVTGLDLAWVLRWTLRHDLGEPLRALARARAHELAGETLSGLAETDERERSGILSTTARLLAAYRSPAALAATTNPNFDPDHFVHSRDTLYLVAPSQLQHQLAPIVVCLLDQIRHHTYPRHPSWPPVLFALDEAANIAPLPDLPAIVAEGGSQGLVTLTCLQDLNQARTRWGPAADGFLTLHAAKLALGGIADPTTLRALSYLAGSIDLSYRTHSGRPFSIFGDQISWNTTIQQRPRIPPDTINTLPPGVALLAHTHHPPRIITLHPPPLSPPRPSPHLGPALTALARRAAAVARATLAPKPRRNP